MTPPSSQTVADPRGGLHGGAGPGVSRTPVRAAVLGEAPGRLVVTGLHLDDWLAPEEVRVRVHACGLCHSDLHMIEGELPVPLPTVVGHEIAGTVEAVGSAVTDLAAGERVVACLSMFCGRCQPCRTGRSFLCDRRNDLGRSERPAPRLVDDEGRPVGQVAGLGGLAERTVLHRNSVVAVPTEVPDDRAALLGCAVLTGVGSAVHGARVRPGESVAVIGCGGVGLNVVQGARIAGATRIVAVDLGAARLEQARAFGATDLVDASAGDPVAAVLELTGGVDHAFDVVGRSATVAQAVGMLHAGRTAWVVGIPPMGEQLALPGLPLVTAAKGVQGLLMGANHFPRDIPALADLYLQGRLELDALVSQRIPLEQADAGFDVMRRGEAARVVVTFD